MKRNALAALAATTALLTSLPAHAQSSSSFDAYGRPLATTEQLCDQARQMGGPVTERCAWLQWSGSSAPTQPYTATPAKPAPAAQQPDPAAILEGYRLALSSVAANHGHDGSERVTYDFAKYGYAYRTKMPLWIAMLLDADQNRRDGYISDNPKWKRVPPTGHLDFWQKW
jgi:hypothetical protein